MKTPLSSSRTSYLHPAQLQQQVVRIRFSEGPTWRDVSCGGLQEGGSGEKQSSMEKKGETIINEVAQEQEDSNNSNNSTATTINPCQI